MESSNKYETVQGHTWYHVLFTLMLSFLSVFVYLLHGGKCVQRNKAIKPILTCLIFCVCSSECDGGGDPLFLQTGLSETQL